MTDLENLRKKRMAELMASQQYGAQHQVQEQMAQEQEMEDQIKHIISQILTPEARERLANIRAAKASYARQIEMLLIQLAQAGQLPKKITDEQFKQILGKIGSQKRETKISRR
ncbi:MAG: DNA-binding protein [Candidatus Altiarchaeota archaeon]